MEKLGAPDIRAIRGGTSQGAFAALLGVSQACLHYWESGTHAPTGPAQRLLVLLRDDKDGRIAGFLKDKMVETLRPENHEKEGPDMAKWEPLGKTRKTCQEIVIGRRGRRPTLYLVRCGKPARWRYGVSWAKPMHRCDEHKWLLDGVMKCAVAAAKRVLAPASLVR